MKFGRQFLKLPLSRIHFTGRTPLTLCNPLKPWTKVLLSKQAIAARVFFRIKASRKAAAKQVQQQFKDAPSRMTMMDTGAGLKKNRP